MSHYYTKNNDELKSSEKDIFFKIDEKNFHFITDNGVFSKSGLDFGSRLLIESIVDVKSNNMLDLGSGYGVIGITYKHFNPESKISMTDINIRATELAKKNSQLNNVETEVLNGDGFDDLDQTFDLIVTNPPIRAGKDTIYQLFEESFEHLTTNGNLYFVMNKKHGVSSAIKKCNEIYSNVELVYRKSGYHIIKCTK
ncbi:MAG: class I SAM-dependent methyltransferase [Tenericutes bacterium]|nr:class I SAM-dependent methyltransferase [Mycoplasmatota bacterium]